MSEELFKKAEEAMLQEIAASPEKSQRYIERMRYCHGHKISYYALYTMEQAALILTGTNDTASVKRYKKSGKLAWVRHGIDGVRFFGYQLADFHLNNVVGEKWDGIERRKSLRLENGTSEKSPAPNTGTAADTTPRPDRHLVSALASDLTKKK